MSDRDPDFGVEHDKAYLVEDDRGTRSVAHYHGDTWWEGHAPREGGFRVQLDRAPARLVLEKSA